MRSIIIVTSKLGKGQIEHIKSVFDVIGKMKGGLIVTASDAEIEMIKKEYTILETIEHFELITDSVQLR